MLVAAVGICAMQAASIYVHTLVQHDDMGDFIKSGYPSKNGVSICFHCKTIFFGGYPRDNSEPLKRSLLGSAGLPGDPTIPAFDPMGTSKRWRT